MKYFCIFILMFSCKNLLQEEEEEPEVDTSAITTSPIFAGKSGAERQALLARKYMGAASHGGKAYFAGGLLKESSGEASNLINIFDPEANSWSVANLTTPRYFLNATGVANQVLFGGGYNNDGFSSEVDVYDTQTGAITVTNISIPRCCMAAFTMNNKAFFYNGYAVNAIRNAADVYDPATGTWELVWSPLAASYNYRLAVYQDRVFMRYESAGAGLVPTISEYNATTEEYALLRLEDGDIAIFPRGTSPGGVAVAGNYILFAGGFHYDSELTAEVLIKEGLTQNYQEATLSQARYDYASVGIGNLAIFAGGFTKDGASAVVDIFNSDTLAWSTASLSVARGSLSVALAGSKVVFFGGDTDLADDSGLSDQVDVYDTATGQWESYPLGL